MEEDAIEKLLNSKGLVIPMEILWKAWILLFKNWTIIQKQKEPYFGEYLSSLDKGFSESIKKDPGNVKL